MPSLQKSLSYDTNVFVDEINSFVDGLQGQDKPIDVIVAAIPSYHHLKKAIMEIRRAEAFNRRYEIKFVISKVRAANFYMTPNKNTYQFLIENCMKGIAHAIVFERGVKEKPGALQMLQTLENVNPGAVLQITGRVFELE